MGINIYGLVPQNGHGLVHSTSRLVCEVLIVSAVAAAVAGLQEVRLESCVALQSIAVASATVSRIEVLCSMRQGPSGRALRRNRRWTGAVPCNECGWRASV